MQPWQAWSPPLRYLIMCASAAEKAFASFSRSTSHLCFDCRSAHMPLRSKTIPWLCTWYRPVLQLLHGCARFLFFSVVASVVALVVHVLHVDDGLFACSGSIAVDTLRTEQRNVDRRAKRISVPVLTPCQRISVPQNQMKSPESAKSFMLYVPFRGI